MMNVYFLAWFHMEAVVLKAKETRYLKKGKEKQIIVALDLFSCGFYNIYFLYDSLFINKLIWTNQLYFF